MEKFYQLKPGDCFTVDAIIFINTNWDENIFNFIECIYYPKSWWKFWEKRKLKAVKIMFMGENKNGQSKNSA